VLGQEYFEVDNLVKYQVVNTAGKARGVTVASSDMGVLDPLHRCLYDKLSERPWLLRGEAKPGRFREFTRKEGEVFVSGDYESASDNLRVEVADVILDTLQSMSRCVPSTVWQAARAYLRCWIQYPDSDVPLESEGQLMGNLLCFPLLCLQNYLAFRWVFPEGVPVKINGDDIVFRAPHADFSRWADFVSSVGLVLSRGKTLVSRDYFSLNSGFFWARVNTIPRYIPVTRVNSFVTPFEDWGSLAGSFRSFTRAFRGEARLRAEKIFLSRHKGSIKASGRSTRRGLGIGVSIEALKVAGLWKRECWFFDSIPSCQDVLPESPSRLKWSSIPPGWKRVPATSCRFTGTVEFRGSTEGWEELPFPPKLCERRRAPASVAVLQQTFWAEVAARTWSEQPTRGQLLETYKRNVLGSGWEYAWRDWKKPVPKGLRRLFASRRRVDRTAAEAWVPSKREALVWAPLEEGVGEKTFVGSSVVEFVVYELEAGLLTFEPPVDYEPADHFYGF
jgi:hypothetical protein